MIQGAGQSSPSSSKVPAEMDLGFVGTQNSMLFSGEMVCGLKVEGLDLTPGPNLHRAPAWLIQCGTFRVGGNPQNGGGFVPVPCPVNPFAPALANAAVHRMSQERISAGAARNGTGVE